MAAGLCLFAMFTGIPLAAVEAFTYQYCNDYYCYGYEYGDFMAPYMGNLPVYNNPASNGRGMTYGGMPASYNPSLYGGMPASSSQYGNAGYGNSGYMPSSGQTGPAYGSDCSYPYFNCPRSGYGITRSYPWGDYTSCYWGADYGYYSCNEDPHQWLYDPYSGEYY